MNPSCSSPRGSLASRVAAITPISFPIGTRGNPFSRRSAMLLKSGLENTRSLSSRDLDPILQPCPNFRQWKLLPARFLLSFRVEEFVAFTSFIPLAQNRNPLLMSRVILMDSVFLSQLDQL